MQLEDERDQQHRHGAKEASSNPDVGRAVPTYQRVGIRNLAKQDPKRSNQLLKGQCNTHQQAWEAQLREHHPVEKTNKDDRQTADAALKQAQSEQTRKRKRQLRVSS
jgi:hypothetical protein